MFLEWPVVNRTYCGAGDDKTDTDQGPNTPKKKKLEDCSVDEIRERHIMDDLSDVSEGEIEKSMENMKRASARANKGTRSTGYMASDDYVLEKKKQNSNPKKGNLRE